MREQDVKIEGLEDLIKEFSKLGEDAFDKLKPYSTQAAEVVLNRARGKIHDRTGNLSRSLKVTKPSKKNTQSGLIVAKVGFSKAGAYGVPLELGHRLWYFGKKTNMDVEARPFLRPAADESKEETANIITGGMNKILDEWGE